MWLALRLFITFIILDLCSIEDKICMLSYNEFISRMWVLARCEDCLDAKWKVQFSKFNKKLDYD